MKTFEYTITDEVGIHARPFSTPEYHPSQAW